MVRCLYTGDFQKEDLKVLIEKDYGQHLGFSNEIYIKEGCGIENKENVLKNLEFVSRKIGCKENLLITLNQTHSNKFSFFGRNNKFNKKRIKVDALITNVKNVAISILTADCAPILFYDNSFVKRIKDLIISKSPFISFYLDNIFCYK